MSEKLFPVFIFWTCPTRKQARFYFKSLNTGKTISVGRPFCSDIPLDQLGYVHLSKDQMRQIIKARRAERIYYENLEKIKMARLIMQRRQTFTPQR